MIVWGGRLWHGAFARQTPGYRISLLTYLARSYIRPQEPWREDIPKELLAQYPDRFATMMGQYVGEPWREEGFEAHPSRSVGRSQYD
jgi:ectoine hydroxylase-related dioxygenase (phytanoyl-CoA dioxygenase family)